MSTKTVLAWVRFVPTASWSLIAWFLCVCACLIQLAELKKLRFKGAGVLTTEWKPWFAKIYPFSITLGRMKIFLPGAQEDGRTDAHEDIHIAQIEDLMFLSLLVGLTVALITGDALMGFILWTSGGMWQLPNFLTAMLRYGHLVKWPQEGSFGSKLKTFMADLFVGTAYRDAEHERSAYAQTDPVGPNGESWASMRDSSR